MNVRLKYVDQLKGFGILLVVLGHVIEGYIKSELIIGQEWIALYNLIYAFHMPLFILLSGITFRSAYVSFNGDNIVYQNSRLVRQIKNTLWVYVLWSGVLWAFKMVFSSSVNNPTSLKALVKIPIYAMPTFWFLYILIMFYIFFLLVVHSRKHVFGGLIFGIVTCILQGTIIEILHEITATAFFQYLLFFIIGFLWKDIVAAKILNRIRIFVWGIGIGGLVIYLYNFRDSLSWWTDVPFCGWIMALCLCVIITDAAMTLENKFHGYILCYLGKRSLQIYVMHVIVTAGVRAIAPKIGITFVPIQMVMSLFFGIVAPLCVEWIADKIRIKKVLFKPF